MSSDNRQKTLAALNDLWQGNPIRRTRQGEGSFTLYGRRLAMHLMVQPGVARDFMADPKADDTGFLPRFLLCEPPSTIGTRLHGLTRDGTGPLAAFAARLDGILRASLPMDPDSRALEPRRLVLTADARALLTGFADAIETQQLAGGELSGINSSDGTFLIRAKWKAELKRLSLEGSICRILIDLKKTAQTRWRRPAY